MRPEFSSCVYPKYKYMSVSSLAASDVSSDDEPLIKMKSGRTSPKKQEKKENTPPKSNSTNNKNTGEGLVGSGLCPE